MVNSECSEQGIFQPAHWLLISAEWSIVIMLLWVRQRSALVFLLKWMTEKAEESPHHSACSFTEHCGADLQMVNAKSQLIFK